MVYSKNYVLWEIDRHGMQKVTDWMNLKSTFVQIFHFSFFANSRVILIGFIGRLTWHSHDNACVVN